MTDPLHIDHSENIEFMMRFAQPVIGRVGE
jgi:hypothetical protein